MEAGRGGSWRQEGAGHEQKGRKGRDMDMEARRGGTRRQERGGATEICEDKLDN